MGKTGPAIELLKEQKAFDPSSAIPHEKLGRIYLESGMFQEAITEFETARSLDGHQTSSLDELGAAYARNGRTNDAQKVLGQLMAFQQEGYDLRTSIAWLEHLLGNDVQALESLEIAVEEKANLRELLFAEPDWRNLRQNPRLQALFKRINLVT